MDYNKIIQNIQDKVKRYIIDNNIKSLVIGISGGIDSTVNAALVRPICDELKINLIGRYIHIESNKPIEKGSADLVGNAFCDKFESIDLTMPYNHLMGMLSENEDVYSKEYKIRKGNVKARIRMVALRDLTQKNHGLMIDNSNFTEYNLGFFTVNDNGDISPMKYLFKTDVYEIAKILANHYESIGCTNKSKAINFSIELVPTDGLGITSSDLEQIGAKSYEQVDLILKSIIGFGEQNVKNHLLKLNENSEIESTLNSLFEQHTSEITMNVINRWINSEYKRKRLPIDIVF